MKLYVIEISMKVEENPRYHFKIESADNEAHINIYLEPMLYNCLILRE